MMNFLLTVGLNETDEWMDAVASVV